jgi:hypothetical protein
MISSQITPGIIYAPKTHKGQRATVWSLRTSLVEVSIVPTLCPSARVSKSFLGNAYQEKTKTGPAQAKVSPKSLLGPNKNFLTKSVSRETKHLVSLHKKVRNPSLFVFVVETLDLFLRKLALTFSMISQSFIVS